MGDAVFQHLAQEAALFVPCHVAMSGPDGRELARDVEELGHVRSTFSSQREAAAGGESTDRTVHRVRLGDGAQNEKAHMSGRLRVGRDSAAGNERLDL